MSAALPAASAVPVQSARRGWLYVGVLVVAVLVAVAVKLRTAGVFACAAPPSGADVYLGYCNADAFGDYDHGAFWLGLEPSASAAASRADVLFLGSSRMQFGFSSQATRDWFGQRGARFYLLGFSHTETSLFARTILDRVQARPRAYVINVDRFFEARETEPHATLRRDPEGPARYVEKSRWLAVQRVVCNAVGPVCGNRIGYFRARADGTWRAIGSALETPTGVADGKPEHQARWAEFAANGRRFIDGLGVDPRCVVLTIVPSQETRRAEAEAIAAALGMPLVAPAVEGLRTFDTSHLDVPSAERWSQAFLAAASPALQSCLGGAR